MHSRGKMYDRHVLNTLDKHKMSNLYYIYIYIYIYIHNRGSGTGVGQIHEYITVLDIFYEDA